MILTDEQTRGIVGAHCMTECDTCAELVRATERAVLAKLREPTRAMLQAVDDMHEDRYVARGRAIDAMCRMIDAASKGG